MNDMSWQVASILTLCGFLFIGGLAAFIYGLLRKENKLRPPLPDDRDSVRAFRNAMRQR